MKTFEVSLGDGKILKFSGYASKLTDDVSGFALFNECADKWEWSLMRSNGTEHVMPDVAAVGLSFEKASAKIIAQALRHIADDLEKE